MRLNINIQENYLFVLDQIAVAARKAGRDPEDITLIVVTKRHPLSKVQEAINAGAKHLGENYAEEGVQKILSIQADSGVKWHMIGHIQSRKARMVCEHFNYIDTLDRIKLARRLDRFAEEFGRRLPVLLECNVSGEASKYGFQADDPDKWSDLLPEIEEINKLQNLEICGLMTMAPITPKQDLARPYFARLRQLRDYLVGEFPEVHWGELSMGMSADFEAAILEGATIVRIGSAILGPREAVGNI